MKPKKPKTGGRKKGTPNRATADVRAALAQLAERNIGRLERWIDAVAKEDPGRAADLLLRAIEYHIPKLARSEVTGEVTHSYIAHVPAPAATPEAWTQHYAPNLPPLPN